MSGLVLWFGVFFAWFGGRDCWLEGCGFFLGDSERAKINPVGPRGPAATASRQLLVGKNGGERHAIFPERYVMALIRSWAGQD